MSEEIPIAPAAAAAAAAAAAPAPAPASPVMEEVRPDEAKAAESAPRTVIVNNISEAATTKTLVDFFSFCGAIEHIKLRPLEDEEKTQIAEVTFETVDGANTALLLDNSLILDRPIKIVISSPQAPAADNNGDAAAAANEENPSGENSEFMKVNKYAL